MPNEIAGKVTILPSVVVLLLYVRLTDCISGNYAAVAITHL